MSTKNFHAGRSPDPVAWAGEGDLAQAHRPGSATAERNQFEHQMNGSTSAADRRGRPDRRRTRNHILELRARHQGITVDRRQAARSRAGLLRDARTVIAAWWGSSAEPKK